MGKWVEIHCNCAIRTPVPNSDFLLGRAHRNKGRLTEKEKQDVEEWERTTKDMYECGHRNGVVIEFWPGDIVHVGYLIKRVFHDMRNTFEIFIRVGDWRCYEDEVLLISPDEATLWLMEIEEIQSGFQGIGNLPTQKMEKLLIEFYRDELGRRMDFERRLDEIAEEMPFAPVVALKRNVEQSGWPDVESTIEKVGKTLTDGARLCHSSIEVGNPIRLLW